MLAIPLLELWGFMIRLIYARTNRTDYRQYE